MPAKRFTLAPQESNRRCFRVQDSRAWSASKSKDWKWIISREAMQWILLKYEGSLIRSVNYNCLTQLIKLGVLAVEKLVFWAILRELQDRGQLNELKWAFEATWSRKESVKGANLRNDRETNYYAAGKIIIWRKT